MKHYDYWDKNPHIKFIVLVAIFFVGLIIGHLIKHLITINGWTG